MRTVLKIKLLLVLLAAFAGCENTDPEPTTGNISGKVHPLKGVKRIYLLKGTDTLNISPKADSTFEINNLPAGKYFLGATSNPGFLAPAQTPVIITAGKTMQASPLLFTKLPSEGLFTVTTDGKKHSGAPIFLPGDTAYTVVANAYIFKFQLPTITGPDSFSTSTNQDLKMFVLYNGKVWEASQDSGSAVLKVTAFNRQTKRGDATFTFKAINGKEKELTGTEGTLQYVQFQP